MKGLPYNRRGLIAGLVVFALCFMLLGAFAGPLATANAQQTSTPTLTPTATSTVTPTRVATSAPMVQGNGLVQYLQCGYYGFGVITAGDCVQIHNGSDISTYNTAGQRTFFLDGETGLAAQGVGGIKCVQGSQSVTGSATVIPATLTAAGISTPQFVTKGLAADPVGNYNLVTHTNAAGVVTLKVWGLVAQTPVANTTPVAVDYQVCGSQ